MWDDTHNNDNFDLYTYTAITVVQSVTQFQCTLCMYAEDVKSHTRVHLDKAHALSKQREGQRVQIVVEARFQSLNSHIIYYYAELHTCREGCAGVKSSNS